MLTTLSAHWPLLRDTLKAFHLNMGTSIGTRITKQLSSITMLTALKRLNLQRVDIAEAGVLNHARLIAHIVYTQPAHRLHSWQVAPACRSGTWFGNAAPLWPTWSYRTARAFRTLGCIVA